MGRHFRLLFAVLLGITVVLATEADIPTKSQSDKQVKSAVHPDTSFRKHLLLDCVKRNCLDYQTDAYILDQCILQYCSYNDPDEELGSDHELRSKRSFGSLLRRASVQCSHFCTEEYAISERRECMISCVKATVQSLKTNLFQTPGKKWVDSLTFAKKSRDIPEKRWVDSLTFAKKSGYLPEKKWVDSLTFAKRSEEPEKKWVDSLTFHKRGFLEKKWVDSLTFAKKSGYIPSKKWVDSLTFHKRNDLKWDDNEQKVESGGNGRWLEALNQARKRKITDDKRWVDSLTFHKRSGGKFPFQNEGTTRNLKGIQAAKIKPSPRESGNKPKRRSKRWVNELDYGKRNSHSSAGIQKRWVDELHFGKRDTTEVHKRWVDSLHFAGKRGFDDLLELCIEEKCVGLKGDEFDQCSGLMCVEPMIHNRQSIESHLQRREEQPSPFCKSACHKPERRDWCLTYCV